MRLLVTGGAGFIGSHFVKMVLRGQPDVTVVTYDLLTYAGRQVNLGELAADERKRHLFIQGDIGNHAQIVRIIAEQRITDIVHFAAESHVDLRLTSRVFDFVRTYVTGAHVLLEAALAAAIARFVYVSTDEVYGSLRDGNFATEATPLAPRNPYAASKAAADLLCQSYYHTHDLPVIITRGSNTYGPHQHPEKFAAKCICKALEQEPISIYGTGENQRQWLHVTDHCRGILAALQRGKPGEVYNIGGPDICTNRHLAQTIYRAHDCDDSLLHMVEDRKGHDWRYAMKSDKAAEALGWTPEISLADGLPRTMEWYASHRAWIDGAENLKGGKEEAVA